MARASDGTDVPVSPLPASSSKMGSPSGSLPDLEGTGYRANTMEEKIKEMFVQVAKLPLLIQSVSRFENCVQTLSQTVRKSRILNKWSAALQPVLPHWKRMQQPSPVDPARQDLGKNSERAMGPQPDPQPLGLSGPMAQGHLMTIETQDEDLIRSQAPKMNNREVPFYYDSLASNTTKGLQSGSIIFGKNPICQHTTSLPEFIAKQVRLCF